MMIVYMANGNESYYLQLGRRNAASTMLTELQPSSPVAALPSPECRAYVERVSDWQHTRSTPEVPAFTTIPAFTTGESLHTSQKMINL